MYQVLFIFLSHRVSNLGDHAQQIPQLTHLGFGEMQYTVENKCQLLRRWYVSPPVAGAGRASEARPS